MFGHVQDRDTSYIRQRILKMELPGNRKGERSQRRLMDVEKERVGVTGSTKERARWERMRDDPLW